MICNRVSQVLLQLSVNSFICLTFVVLFWSTTFVHIHMLNEGNIFQFLAATYVDIMRTTGLSQFEAGILFGLHSEYCTCVTFTFFPSIRIVFILKNSSCYCTCLIFSRWYACFKHISFFDLMVLSMACMLHTSGLQGLCRQSKENSFGYSGLL